MSIRTSLLVLIGFLLASQAGNAQPSPASFLDLEDQLWRLSSEAKQAEVVDLLDSVSHDYPDNQFEISDWYGRLYLELKQYEKAFDVWADGHTKGYFYMLHPNIPLFKEVADIPRFKELSEADLALRSKAMETSQTISEIVLPDNYDPSNSYPLLIALHGGAGTIERAKRHWQSERLSSDFVVMFVQSYRHYNLKKFGWSGGDERSRADIRKLYDELVKEYRIDTTRVIIGGISAGWGMTIDIALSSSIPLAGFYGVCPGKPRAFEAELVAGMKARGLKGYIIAGETDFFHDRQVEMNALFDEAGLPYEYHVIEGLGHEFPEDFGDWIDRGLAYLL